MCQALTASCIIKEAVVSQRRLVNNNKIITAIPDAFVFPSKDKAHCPLLKPSPTQVGPPVPHLNGSLWL